MPRRRTRLLAIVLSLIALLFTAALVYRFGMARLEGQQRTFLQSLEWAAETLSTTGYGADSRWSHPVMVLFVIVVQFIGVFLVPLLVALYLVPFLSERFEQRLPRRASDRIENHVIVFRYGPAVESLLQRLGERGIATLVVDTDEVRARRVMELGQPLVFSRSDEDVLDASAIERAQSLVVNGQDEENAAVVLRARQMGFRRDIYAFVEEPSHRKPMELAGATAVYTPRHIIAAALAAHASEQLSPRLPGIEALTGIARRDVRVTAASPLAGRTLRDAAIPATVVGQWTRGRLITRCDAELRMEPGSVLELVGTPAALAASAALLGAPLLRSEGPFLIGGFGEVGRKVHQLLTDVGENVRVMERRPGPGVDVVGDVLDSTVLGLAGIETSRALVLALDSDDATLFATVIARDAAPDVPIVARVNHARNVDNIYRAGADYALSISDVSGEMLFSRLLGGQARAREEHRVVRELPGDEFAGRAVSELALRARGCSLLALHRHGAPIDFTPATRIEAGDVLFVCGTR